MTAREAIRAAAERLAGISETPRLDAEILAAHLLGVERETLLLDHLDRAIDAAAFDTLIARRAAHEPIAYIIGEREFWSLPIAVRPGVLIPRPDSETLIEAARDHFDDAAPSTILDLGTGSGALLLAALSIWPEALGMGIDRSETALNCASDNAARLGLAGRAEFRKDNWSEGVPGAFDLILCNPPYVETEAGLAADVRDFEPAEALFAGEDGLEDIRRLAPQIGPLLAEDGIACVEIGHGQGPAAAALFADQGLKTYLRQDLAGHDRCVIIHN
ncbi:MAG: peptide chain release factor N(5)-glutamine methyltransferase [Sphingomonadaceae bacterium]|nr:peptide chain release factor N(5)-glutamine methyltransferase [Sphingomonadaceae bacterium]